MKSFVTYAIQLPDNSEAKTKILDGIGDLIKKHGGKITGSSVEDELTVLDMIEQHEDFQSHIADDARKQASALLSQIYG